MQIKKQVVDRLLGEVSHSGDVYQNALAIAHVFVNRAKATGTTLDSVTGLQSQVNAQKPAKGSEKNREIVAKALQDAATGKAPDPTNGATYYATPKSYGNLPSGLEKTKTVGGHVFATDPQNRPIKTADGVKKVNPLNINTPVPAAKPAQTVPKDTSSPFGVALGSKTPFSEIRDSMNYKNPAQGGRFPAAAASMDYQTVDSIERANSAFRQLGIDPTINSSFREGPSSPADKQPTGANYNKAVGGAAGSRHQFGDAFDVSTSGMSGKEKAAIVDGLIAKGFNGIGLGANVVHADMRPNGTGLWDYASQREKDWPSEVKDVLSARNFNDGTTPNRYPSQFVQHPTPTPRPAEQKSNGSIDVAQGYSGPKSPLNAYFKNVPNTPGGNFSNGLSGNVSGSPVTPSPSSLYMANRTAGLPSGGFGSSPSQGIFSRSAPAAPTGAGAGSSSPDPWAMPADIQQASLRAREALGTGSNPTPAARPAPQQSQSGYTSGQFSGSPSSVPQYISKTVSEQVPKAPSAPQPVPTPDFSIYGGQMAAGPVPIPTAKPAPEYETVTKQIQVANPAYKAPVPQMMAPPLPPPKPAMPQQPQGILGALGGMFNPSGTAGGLLGGALGGPLGSIAGNLAGRGISSVVSRNPTVANRGTTNSIGTGNNSGGPYSGQSWRNTSTGGVRTFNPSTRQYEDIGGSNAGNRSSSQQTGSGGGFFSSLFG